MTEIAKEEIEKIAHLARLAVDEESIMRYKHDISRILTLANSLPDVDVQEVPPMLHPLQHAQILRADCVTEIDQHQAFQSIAPQIEADLYLVPQVIE